MREGLRLALWPVGPVALFAATITTAVVIEIARDIPAWLEGYWETESGPAGAMPLPSDGDETLSFTLFRTTVADGLAVTTGAHYDRPSDQPRQQYCYAEKPTSGNRSVIVRLADQPAGSSPRYRAIAAQDAAALGKSSVELERLAQAACRFVGVAGGPNV